MKMRDTTADELYSQLSANKMLVRLISIEQARKDYLLLQYFDAFLTLSHVMESSLL